MDSAELQSLKARCLEAMQRGYIVGHAALHMENLAKAAGQKLPKDAEATPEALLALIESLEGKPAKAAKAAPEPEPEPEDEGDGEESEDEGESEDKPKAKKKKKR